MQPRDWKELRGEFEFVRSEADDQRLDPRRLADYGKILAAKMYRKLFRERVAVDLTRADQGEVGCRWLTRRDVLLGKSELVCGNDACSESRVVDDYEFVFAYRERDATRRAMVKCKMCRECADTLRAVHKRKTKST